MDNPLIIWRHMADFLVILGFVYFSLFLNKESISMSFL